LRAFSRHDQNRLNPSFNIVLTASTLRYFVNYRKLEGPLYYLGSDYQLVMNI